MISSLASNAGQPSHTQAHIDASVSRIAGNDNLLARAAAGDRLTPVEEGQLARTLDLARGGGAKAPSKSHPAAAKARTAADFKVINGNKQDVADLNAALKYLGTSKTASALLAKLPKGTKIEIIHDGNDAYDPNTKTIYWDPRSGLAVSSGAGNQSAALGLIHEIDHAVNGQKNPKPTGDGYQNTEEKRVITGSETKIAKELGEPTRKDHFGTPVVLGSSTEHTKVK